MPVLQGTDEFELSVHDVGVEVDEVFGVDGASLLEFGLVELVIRQSVLEVDVHLLQQLRLILIRKVRVLNVVRRRHLLTRLALDSLPSAFFWRLD